MKTISVEISLEFDRKLRMLAAKMDLNRSAFIRQVLEEKVARLQNPASDGDVDNPGGSPAGGSSAEPNAASS